MELSGRRVLVMGLGLFGGGVGAVRYLCAAGARVTVTDLRGEGDLHESLRSIQDLEVEYRLGGHSAADFRRADLVVANPAVPRTSEYLLAAVSAGVPVTTEIALFVAQCESPVVGITGTSGKTTTTCLVAEMLRRTVPQTLVGGNLGGSLLDRLGGTGPDVPVVLELSSFQLDRLGELPWSPDTAVVTNFAPNHLDIHGSLDAYRDAKRQILAHQDSEGQSVLNVDDAEVASWETLGGGRTVPFSLERSLDCGVFVQGGEVRQTITGAEDEVCAVSKLRLPGRHNLANALAATGAALCQGAPVSEVRHVLESFQGVEHRMERVSEVCGVTYYNDSIATSPDRTAVALEAFSRPVVLVAGGYDKGIGYGCLGELIARKVRHLVVLGATADAIAAAVPPGAATGVHRVGSLEEAVSTTTALAEHGDVVLLSPASASYDMFMNFEERGKAFKRLVRALAESGGENVSE